MINFGRRSIPLKAAMIALIIYAAFTGSVKAGEQIALFGDEMVQKYVNTASAIIYVPKLTRGALLQMRGAYGSAYFTRKALDNTWCDAAPLRILFGDFDGVSSGISMTGSVVLIVMNPAVADKLTQGKDIVGDDVSLVDINNSSTHSLEGADIVVAGAASANSGMVLNPGRSILNDLFGASTADNSCGHMSAVEALTASKTQN